MNKQRLETISDGIFAIIITVMLVELKIPEGSDFTALKSELHFILSYLLSFIYIGIYWNNHHHLFQVVKNINGKILWINLHLMFWLTMIPFVTAWSSATNYAAFPTASYAFILFMCSLSYRLLERMLIRTEGEQSLIAHLLGRDSKLFLSVLLYGTSIFLSFIDPRLALLTLSMLAIFWFFPNKKIEQHFSGASSDE